MSDPNELRCGAYEGRCFGAPDDDGSLGSVGGDRLLEVELYVIPDSDASLVEE
jgi:hypothetical protein